ncbi:MAG: GAF domain-containing protein [Verrucomicrobia bacterium]|nr:GAF domain-containing protein [Verrucomicrobiota bacterium]
MPEHGEIPAPGEGSENRPAQTPKPVESLGQLSGTGINLVSQIFAHRLQQSDVERILAVLSATDRQEFVSKIGDLLKRISALLDVYNRIADVLSLDLLLQRLIEIITETLNADRTTLYLYDPESRELFSRIAQGELTREIRFPSHLGIAGSVFSTGEHVIIDDCYADARFNPEVDRKTGYRTRNMLCTPMRNKRKQIIGVSQVLNKAQGHFSLDDMAMLEAITTQAAAALENAQLHERVEKARREEEKMLEVTNAISTELQLEPLLHKIMQVTTQILEADRSTLFLHDSKTKELWSRVGMGIGSKEIRFPDSAGIAGSVFTSGQTLNIPDAYRDARFNPEVDRRTGYHTRNILCMPVVNKAGRTIGVTQVLNKKGGPFTAEDERRLRAFSAQAAIALENAQLFEEVTNARNYNESIVKSLSNGVVTLNADRIVIKANDAAVKILRETEQSLIGHPIAELFSGKNAWILDSLSNVARTGTTDLALDSDLVLRDGSRVSVNSAVVPLINIKNEPIGSMLIFEDISSEKRVKSTMARYMSKDVVDKLLEDGGDTLVGSDQEVTILFSDIRNFTTLSEKIGARGTVSMLNSYFAEMVDIVFNHGGILDKYIGDALMAIFGTPFKKPDDPENAVAVAIEMILTLRRYNARRIAERQEPIDIGIGINTGEVVVGNIGSPKRMDYTVIGDGVNLAARLESATKYYGTQILISEATCNRLKQGRIIRELDLIRVKGKAKPISVYEVLDFHTEATFPKLTETLRIFEGGYRRYKDRNWKEAMALFMQALNLFPQDKPSKIYYQRCLHYQANPPDPSWSGVWTMTEK